MHFKEMIKALGRPPLWADCDAQTAWATKSRARIRARAQQELRSFWLPVSLGAFGSCRWRTVVVNSPAGIGLPSLVSASEGPTFKHGGDLRGLRNGT